MPHSQLAATTTEHLWYEPPPATSKKQADLAAQPDTDREHRPPPTRHSVEANGTDLDGSTMENATDMDEMQGVVTSTEADGSVCTTHPA